MPKPVLEIDTMPFPVKRKVTSRYEDTFKRLRAGECLKVLPEDVDKISKAFVTYLKNSGKAVDFKASMRTECEDGFARIWMLPKKPVKMADVPGRVINKLDMEAA